MPPKRKSKSENAFISDYSLKREELKSAIQKEAAGQQPNESEQKASEEIDITEHLKTNDEVLSMWDSKVDTGLDDAQVQEKLITFGKNCLTPPPKKSIILIFLSHLTGFFSLLLWAASVLCFIAYALKPTDVENLALGIVLAIVVTITGIFSFYQDYQSAAVMDGFKKFLPASSNVTRNGETIGVPSEDLVPGDIVHLKAGDAIPADVRVLDSKSFKVNNSSLTGESLPQKRTHENTKESPLEATNLAFYGTLCEGGSCVGIVIATADNTVIGKIANLTAGTDNIQTPINQEIHHFILIISAVAIFLGVTFMIIGFIKEMGLVSTLVLAIGIIVANVPEGLLATVTVALTLTAKKMAVKKVLVKNLEAVETLGSTTVIASDKTGTLTQNIMTVKHVYYNRQVKDAYGEGSSSFDNNDTTFKRLRLVATLCNNANFDKSKDNLKLDIQQRITIGDASESALVKFCEKTLLSDGGIETCRANNNKLAEIPFNSANKYQVSIHMMNNNPEEARLLVMKGAPERILARCDYMLVDGKAVEITPDMIESYDRDIQGLMEEGERVLGMAYIELDPEKFGPDFDYNIDDPNFPMNKGEGLVFSGLMSLQDPPRPAVPGAVTACQSAGIKVIMVTGDHPDTAEAIAKQVQIISGVTRKSLAKERGVPVSEVNPLDPKIDAVVITGGELLKMDDDDLDYYLDFKQVVFARTSPAQKLRIVQGLQNKRLITRGFPDDAPMPVEHVVAVTGDGVNDSPALKAANIGVAMGIVGSDVAKQAADMILLNDNFASIVDGVEEGRLIFDNLKKSIAYTLSSNIPEISPFLIFILINIPLPLPTALILCIDLGTDMVPAISLAYESKEANIMQKPPRDMRTDRLVTAKLINFSYLQIGMVQAAAGFYTYIVVLMNYGFPPHTLLNKGHMFFKNAVTIHANATTAINGTGWMEYQGTLESPLAPEDYQRFELGECRFDAATEPLCWNSDSFQGALQHAQCAFFIAIIVVQWADLAICKTRTLSIFEQGMRNNTLNFGLFFTTVLGSILCYVPGIDYIGTAPLAFVNWCPAMPFCILIFLYDEVRKALIRRSPGGWVDRMTYY